MDFGDNSSRDRVMLTFCCANCGEVLRVRYRETKHQPHESGDPTGMMMVKVVNEVFPCHKCYKPMEDVKEALATLARIGG